MELLRLVETTNIGAVTREWVSYIQKTCTSINITHIFSLLVAFPAALTSLKITREDWVGGAAVWLTAAAVPSHEFENLNARSMRCTTSDGHKHDGCSEGRNVVDDGRRGW
jgi:ABC-type uncharacterized transport system permease subunit